VKGVQLTIMVVGTCYIESGVHNNVDSISEGASGTGRTTFVNTLCESDVLQHKVIESPEEAHIEAGIKIKPANVGQFLNSSTNPSTRII
jgi:hypothetical protein